MREGEREIVRIGVKLPVDDYIAAVLHALRNYSSVVVEGLGRTQGKVITVAKSAAELARVHIVNVESFDIDGTPGVRVLLEREGGEHG